MSGASFPASDFHKFCKIPKHPREPGEKKKVIACEVGNPPISMDFPTIHQGLSGIDGFSPCATESGYIWGHFLLLALGAFSIAISTAILLLAFCQMTLQNDLPK